MWHDEKFGPKCLYTECFVIVVKGCIHTSESSNTKIVVIPVVWFVTKMRQFVPLLSVTCRIALIR